MTFHRAKDDSVKDAQKIEFTVKLAPDEEKKVTFAAHYTW